MTDKTSFPIVKGLQRKLYSEVVDWSALWGFVDGFDDIPRVRGRLVKWTVTPTLAFRMRYNEDGSINHTLKEIAEHFSVTSNAVRHHIEKGIRRLNHPGRRVSWGVLLPDMAKKWREINIRNNRPNKTVIPFELSAVLELFSPDDPSRPIPPIGTSFGIKLAATDMPADVGPLINEHFGEKFSFALVPISALNPYVHAGILSFECRHQDHIESKEKQMNEPTDQTIAPFEVWGILECLGHEKVAGLISEQELFGTKLGRIDIPTENGQMITQYFGGDSIYRLTAVSEAVARAFAARNVPRPVSIYDLKLAAPEPEEEEDYDNE